MTGNATDLAPFTPDEAAYVAGWFKAMYPEEYLIALANAKETLARVAKLRRRA